MQMSWETWRQESACEWFVASLSIIAKTWKHRCYPSLEQFIWINKLWYIQAMEYYSAGKSNELSSHEDAWRNFKCMLLSERNQPEKAAYCVIPTIWHSGEVKTMKILVKRSVGWWGGMNMQSTEGFRTVDLFCTILYWWVRVLIHLSKPIQCRTPRGNPKVN